MYLCVQVYMGLAKQLLMTGFVGGRTTNRKRPSVALVLQWSLPGLLNLSTKIMMPSIN